MKTKDVAVQRDILSLLMAVSSKEGAVVDLDKALSYALSPVPLALATSDGKACKSKLISSPTWHGSPHYYAKISIFAIVG